jgi:ankyrin repeat protein
MEFYKSALIEACGDGLIEVVSAILRTPQIFLPNGTGRECLLAACNSQKLEVAKLLLEVPLFNIRSDPDLLGTALCKACELGDVNMVELLLSVPATPTATPNTSHSPLVLACLLGHLPIMRLLLPRSDPNTSGETHFTPLYATCYTGYVEMAQELLADPRLDPNLSDGQASPLGMACQRGNAELVRLLLSDPRVDPNSGGKQGLSPIHQSCHQSSSKKNVTAILAADPRVDINNKASWGETPLMRACCCKLKPGGSDPATDLLRCGRWLDLDARDKNGKSARDIALCKGRLEIVAEIDSLQTSEPNPPILPR